MFRRVPRKMKKKAKAFFISKCNLSKKAKFREWKLTIDNRIVVGIISPKN